VESLLNNSGREGIIIVVWTASEEVPKLSNNVDLKNSMKLVVLFKTCMQRERKAMSFSSFCNLNFNRVVGLFTLVSLYKILFN